MDFNPTNFEGFIIPKNNNQTSNLYVSSTESNMIKAGTKLFDAQKKTMVEATMAGNAEAASSLNKTSNMASEPENRQTLHALLPPPLVSRPNANHDQLLKIGSHEQKQPFGFNNFYVPINPSLRSHKQQQMFNSSSEPEIVPFFIKNVGFEQRISSQDFTPNQLPPSSNRSCIGHESESLNMNGVMDGARGPLTQSQLMELQNQNLIYNYISANMCVPPDLLTRVNHSLCSHCFPPSSSSPKKWGTLRQVYAGSCIDPEPGRCRRSDGKKWRCSNDAVSDEKYCEKHRNRGRIRQRSRKTTGGRRARLIAANIGTSTISAEPGTISTSTLGKAESGVYFKSLVNMQ